jgi:signal transduction histidine kinase
LHDPVLVALSADFPEVKAAAFMPIVVGTERISLLYFGFDSPRHFTDMERNYFVALMRQARHSAERTELRRALQLTQTCVSGTMHLFEPNLRDSFIASVAHDLRTPLTALSLQLDRSMRCGPSGEVLRDMRVQVHRLRHLSENLLDAARLQVGGLAVTSSMTRIGDAIGDAVACFVDHAARVGVPIVVEGATSACGLWDRWRLSRLLANLIANAIAFGEHTPILIQVSEGVGGLRVSVHDDGIGIAQEDQERIFKRFVRLNSLTRYPGPVARTPGHSRTPGRLRC